MTRIGLKWFYLVDHIEYPELKIIRVNLIEIETLNLHLQQPTIPFENVIKASRQKREISKFYTEKTEKLVYLMLERSNQSLLQCKKNHQNNQFYIKKVNTMTFVLKKTIRLYWN